LTFDIWPAQHIDDIANQLKLKSSPVLEDIWAHVQYTWGSTKSASVNKN